MSIETNLPVVDVETVVSDRRDESTTRNDADVTVTSDGMTLTDVPDDAVTEHEAILADGRKLSTKGANRNIPVGQLWRSDNPRELYDLDGLVRSIRLHGFYRNEPIMVVERTNPDNPEQRFLVVRGNRRSMAIEAIFADYPDDAEIIFPKGCVPCVNYKGCTDSEVAMLRMDFDKRAGKRDLDGWELFLAVRILTREGIHSESAIAQLLGLVKDGPDGTEVPNRSFVQNRVRLSRMPVDVQNLFKPVLRGDRKTTKLRVADIAKLATAFRAGKDNPDSPVFREKLDSLVNRPDADSSGSDDSANPIKHKDLKDRMNSFDSPIMRDILHVIVFGEGANTLSSLDARLVRDMPVAPASDDGVDGDDESDCPEGWDRVEGDDDSETSGE